MYDALYCHQLYDVAIRTKNHGGVEFVTFEGVHGYGHKHIHKAPELPSIVRYAKFCELPCDVRLRD